VLEGFCCRAEKDCIKSLGRMAQDFLCKTERERALEVQFSGKIPGIRFLCAA